MKFAYVRFCFCIQGSFKDVNTFMDEIKKILKKVVNTLKSNKCLRTAEKLIRKVVITDV